MKKSAEQIAELVLGLVTLDLTATVVKGKDSYRASVTSGANVGMEPVDAAGKDITFGTVDAAIKWVGHACQNATMVVNLAVGESVKLFHKPVYATLAAANAAKKAKLLTRVTVITAARAKLVQTKTDYETMGYNTSVIPAVLAKYTNVVAQIAVVDAVLVDVNALVAAL